MSDVAIVGAGIGGLASAALLAARGLSVAVFERGARAGGKIRQIDGVDAGPTVFTLRDVFDQLFDDCGASLDSALTLTRATTLARHAWSEDRLDLYADPMRSEAAIGDFAGLDAARGYRAFAAEAAHIFETLDGAFMRRPKTDPLTLTWRTGFARLNAIRPYESLWRALGGHFSDPRLRQLFARYATYTGSSPFRAPATLMLIAHAEAKGVWLAEGGMQALADALEALGRRLGVRVRYGAEVERVLVERGRAAGLMLAGGERIAATRIISNADPATIGLAAPPRVPSLSALVWTGRVAAEGFALERHNVFFSKDYPAEFAALARGRLPLDPTVYLCAQDRPSPGLLPTSGHGLAELERVQLIVNAPPAGDAIPQAEIEQCTSAMRERLARSGLTLSGDLRLTTPGDFAATFRSPGGALYGRASHGWAASFLRPSSRTRIPGLYLAGGSCHPGAGVPMAALSGRLAAEAVLQDRASTSQSRLAAMAGGISTPSAKTAASG